MTYTSNIIDIVKVRDGAPGATGQSLYTWIVYANADGIGEDGILINPTDFSKTDSYNRAYIGILANQTTIEESNDYTLYKWSKIQGEQGAPGESGQSYFIEINTNEIKRFYLGKDSSDEDLVEFSPNKISFYARDFNDARIDFDKENFEFLVEVLFDYSSNSTLEIPSSFISYENELLPDGTQVDPPRKIFSLSIDSLSSNTNFSRIKNDDVLFIFTLLKENKIVSTRALLCGWALSEDYAKFSVTATQIQASIDGAGLSFGLDGLTIKNSGEGGLKIVRVDEYTITTDEYAVPGKTYYELVNGVYEEISPAEGTDVSLYYERTMTETPVLIADTSGSAYFSGTIKAEEGNLGNIVLKDGGLSYTEGENLIFSLNEDGLIANQGSLGDLSLTGNLTMTSGGGITSLREDGSVGFKLNGEDGSIIANNITIGSAILSDYLRMGENCWIFNPDAYTSNQSINLESNWQENSFINVNYVDDGILKTAVSITKDGYIRLRYSDSDNLGIVLDGKEGAIYSAKPNTGASWRIDNDSAVFNNITARGSLKCSVLEYGEAQSVGGILLIRPSSIIKNYRFVMDSTQEEPYGYYLTLENSDQFNIDDYCKIQVLNNISYVVKITNKIDPNTVTFVYTEEIQEDLTGASIISFGNRTSLEGLDTEEFSENVTSYGIGLNASSNSALVPARALSLVNFYYDGTDILADNKIILGYIPNNALLYGAIAGQYGLYADNVLVKGKLISGVGEDTLVSGVDSLSTIKIPGNIGTYFDENKRDGNIIFWAGANGQHNIQGSPFWVDSYGNMYAGSGYFNGAIITESTIEAVEIRTAIITGIGDGDYALKIRNDNGNNSKAIRFYSSEEENYFSLTREELSIGASTQLTIGTNTLIDNYGVISPCFKTSSSSLSSIINDFQIGFLRNGLAGFYLQEDNTLFLENNGQYISLNTDVISTIKRLSVDAEFNLWNVQFKRIQKDGITIGFDLEIED